MKTNAVHKKQAEKRVCSLLLTLALLASLLPAVRLSAQASGSYNAAAALSYAASHWNDGNGECAEFASRCINAGGCGCFSASGSSLHGQLLSSGMGTEYEIPLNSDKSITAANYRGRLEAGDVVFYYCPGCANRDGKPYIHTVICNGMDSNGYMQVYAHNSAHNGSGKYCYASTCYDCHTPINTAYVYHFNGNNDGGSSGGSDTTHYRGLYTVHTDGGVLYMRSAPGTGNSQIGKLDNGTRINVTDISGNWGYARADDQEGWVSLDWCSLDHPFVSCGSDFYAYIINKAPWKHIENALRNVQIAANGNDSTDPKQIWHFVLQSNGTYCITNEYNDTCLDACDVGRSDGTNIQSYPSNGCDAQRWYLCENGGGFNIVSCYTNKVMDMNGNDSAAGTNIQLWTPNDSGAQIFTIYMLTNDGVNYAKPSRPAKPVLTAPSTAAVGQSVHISWSGAPTNGRFDSRSYTLRVFKNGQGYYEKSGLSGTSADVTFSETGSFSLQIAAVNTKYDQWYTDSNTVAINVTNAPKPSYTVSYAAAGASNVPASQTKTQDQTLTLSSTKPTKYCTLTFEGNGGSVSTDTKYLYYTFKSWNTKADGSGTSYAPGESYTGNAPLTLYAQWTNPQLGFIPPAVTRNGYSFAGWYTAASGGTQYSSATTVTGDLTLYAHWTAQSSYTVSYDANGGTDAPASQTKPQNQSLTLTAALPQKSYTLYFKENGGSQPLHPIVDCSCTFKGWNTRADGSGVSYAPGESYTGNASLTLYAQWTNPQLGSIAPVVTRSGYTFAGWYTDETGGTQYTSATTLTGNQVLYAHWTAQGSCTVSYNPNGGSGEPASQTKAQDQSLTLSSVKPESHLVLSFDANGGSLSADNAVRLACVFNGWNTKSDGSGVSYAPGASYTGNASLTLYAQWSNPLIGSVLPAATRSGYNFDGWYTAASGGKQVEAGSVVPASRTLYAHWTKTAEISNPFLDVSKDDFYYAPILWAYSSGIASGTDSSSFSPEKNCTRGQVITFLWRAKGSPAPGSAVSPFSDVSDPNAYDYKAILWAAENDVASGISDSFFGADLPVTRGQFVTFEWRSAGRPASGTSNPFSDIPQSSYCRESVLWAYGSRITTGTSATTFSPDSYCTRGQVVTFLYRYFAK